MFIDPAAASSELGVVALCRPAKTDLPAFINGHRPFLLLLDQDLAFSPDALEALGVCLFSPAYLRWEGKPVVAIKGAVSTEVLWEAGWEDIQVWPLSSESLTDQLRVRQSPLWVEPGAQPDDIDIKASFFGHWDYVGSYVFFGGLAPEGGPAASASAAEHAFQLSLQTDPLTQKAIDAYLDAQTQIKELKAERRILEDRLKASTVIVETVRTKYKEDYDTLYAFHHREYTPLPLWFKRLGQLLKVMTGKRTLKSLIQRNKA